MKTYQVTIKSSVPKSLIFFACEGLPPFSDLFFARAAAKERANQTGRVHYIIADGVKPMAVKPSPRQRRRHKHK